LGAELALIFVAVVIVAALLAISRLKRRRQVAVYEARPGLFTAAERSFLGVLEKAVGDRYRVFGKVRVADLLKTVKGLSNSDRQSALNKIVGKHVDFVLCHPGTLAVKAVIELNDRSHTSGKRAARDAFLRDAFAQAGIPLLEIRARRSYTLETVKAALSEVQKGEERAPEDGDDKSGEATVDGDRGETLKGR